MVEPDFVEGNEQSGWRPALVVSDDRFNQGTAGLSIVVPATSMTRQIATHVRVAPPEGGLQRPSDLMCEQVRALTHLRFHRRLGRVHDSTLGQVESVLRRLLGLG